MMNRAELIETLENFNVETDRLPNGETWNYDEDHRCAKVFFDMPYTVDLADHLDLAPMTADNIFNRAPFLIDGIDWKSDKWPTTKWREVTPQQVAQLLREAA